MVICVFTACSYFVSPKFNIAVSKITCDIAELSQSCCNKSKQVAVVFFVLSIMASCQ